LLSGCAVDNGKKTNDISNVRVICADGVEYYKSRYSLTVKIDRDTLMAIRCE